MRIGQALLFVFGMGLLGTPSNSPAAERWNDLYQQALGAAERGAFETADALLQTSLRQLPHEESVAAVVLWNEMGSVHQRVGKDTEAEHDFTRALEINGKLSKPDENETAVALNNLGTIAGRRHDPGRAEELLRQAYRELEKGKATDGATAALITGNLALTLQQEGRYAEAGPLYKQAAAAVKAHFGEKSIEYARTLTNLCLFQFQIGDYRSAAESSELARSIEDGLPYASNLERALTLNNLGMSLAQIGSVEKAESALREAIRLETSTPGDRTQFAISLNSLAAVEEKKGQLEEAREQELEVLVLSAQGALVEDLTLASALNILGRIATTEHKFDEARQRYAWACELLEKTTGALRVQYAATLSNIGALETAQRHYKKAEVLYRKALAVDEAQLGSHHPAVASDESNVAAELFYQRRMDEALKLYGKSKPVVEASFGPVSPEMARLWRNIAIVSASEKRFEDATTAYGKAVETLDKVSAGKDASLASWLRDYAAALRKEQRWGEAEAAETRALGIEVRNTLAAQKQAASRMNRQEERSSPSVGF